MTSIPKYILSFVLLIFAVLTFGYRTDSSGNFSVYLISISVKNIDSAAGWYHKYFGFEFGEKKDYPENKVSIGIMTKGSLNLELVQHKESVHISRFIPGLTNPAVLQGYGKVGYSVGNIDQLIKIMKDDSVKFILEPRESKVSGSKMCIVADNSGNWIQLMQKR